ncbi:hypothetical protein [uncultured Psychrobacter sp.]|uniref:hypothetical protein n=1 Tax=uncultured Psychrobacter sp. TaxID=259303 RepID=UPI003457DA0E
MTILDQLEQTVTLSILDGGNSAYVSLLEQFYAILITRLAWSGVYRQLSHNEQTMQLDTKSNQTLFEQIWQEPAQRQLLIDELAATYHADKKTTEQLLVDTVYPSCLELENLADGQYLPAFLQTQQALVRPYLPVWAEKVLPSLAQTFESSADVSTMYNEMTNNNTADDNDLKTDVGVSSVAQSTLLTKSVTIDLARAETPSNEPLLASANTLSATPIESINPTNAIHANPSYHYDVSTSKRRSTTSPRSHKNNLLIRGLLLVGLLAAVGFVWLLIIQPYYKPAIEPTVAPIITNTTAPTQKPVALVTIPAKLLVGVDNVGNLYTCTATVGSIELQDIIKQAMQISFGEQTDICKLTIQEGRANQISTIDVQTLSSLLTLLRSVPFARLQLQDETLSLEAPDATMLQQLLTDIRTLAPTLTINSVAPLSQPYYDSLNNDKTEMIESRSEAANENTSIDDPYTNAYPDNAMNAEQKYQQLDADKTAPAPVYNNFDSSNNEDNSFNNGARRSASISSLEVDDLANSTIVAEQLSGENSINAD